VLTRRRERPRKDGRTPCSVTTVPPCYVVTVTRTHSNEWWDDDHESEESHLLSRYCLGVTEQMCETSHGSQCLDLGSIPALDSSNTDKKETSRTITVPRLRYNNAVALVLTALNISKGFLRNKLSP
jgi:hypothetical protein